MKNENLTAEAMQFCNVNRFRKLDLQADDDDMGLPYSSSSIMYGGKSSGITKSTKSLEDNQVSGKSDQSQRINIPSLFKHPDLVKQRSNQNSQGISVQFYYDMEHKKYIQQSSEKNIVKTKPLKRKNFDINWPSALSPVYSDEEFSKLFFFKENSTKISEKTIKRKANRFGWATKISFIK